MLNHIADAEAISMRFIIGRCTKVQKATQITRNPGRNVTQHHKVEANILSPSVSSASSADCKANAD
jgi:hypothetical protein